MATGPRDGTNGSTSWLQLERLADKNIGVVSSCFTEVDRMWRIAANRRGWLIAGALGLAATQALAQKNFWDITEADLVVLPPFCRTVAAVRRF